MPSELQKDDILRIIDADTVESQDGTRHRLLDGDAPETDDPRSGLAVEAVNEIIESGGKVVPTGERDYPYNRSLSKLETADGENAMVELSRAGVVAPTSHESEQAALTGVVREALGRPRSDKTSIQKYERENDYSYDPFTDSNIAGSKAAVSYDKRGTFSRSFDRGVDDMQASLGGAINWLGDAIGDQDLVEYGKEVALSNSASAASNVRRVKDFDHINDFDSLFDYAIETLGEAAPSLIVDTVAAVATGGGSLGFSLARGAGTAALKSAVKRGALTGPAIMGALQSLGNMENRLEEQGSEVNTGAGLASGVVGGAVNVAPFAKVFGDIAKASKLGDEAIATVMGRVKDVSKKMTKTGVMTGGIEGAVTAAQKLVDELIVAEALDTDFQVDTMQLIDDTIRGVLGGTVAGGGAMGAFGMAQHATQYSQARRDAQKEQDALGNKVDAEGFIVDDEGNQVIQEQDDPDSGFIKPLKSKEYDFVAEKLEPGGNPVDLKTASMLVESGQLTWDEVARYVSDPINNPGGIVHRNSKRDPNVSELESTAKELIKKARDTGTFVRQAAELTKALKETDPKVKTEKLTEALGDFGMAQAKKKVNKYDGRRMYHEYVQQNAKTSRSVRTTDDLNKELNSVRKSETPKQHQSDRARVEEGKVKSAEVDARRKAQADETRQRTKILEVAATSDKRLKEATIKRADKSTPDALHNTANQLPLETKVRVIAEMANEGVDLAKKVLKRLPALIESGKEAEVNKLATDTYLELTAEDGDSRTKEVNQLFEETREIARPEIDDDGSQRTVGDVQDTISLEDGFTEVDFRSKAEVVQDRGRRKAANKDLVNQLKRHPKMKALGDKVDNLLSYLNQDTTREKEVGGKEVLSAARHPNKVIFEGEDDAPSKTAGKDPARMNRRVHEKTIDKIVEAVDNNRLDVARNELEKLGLVADVPVVGDGPKRSLTQKIQSIVEHSSYDFNRRNKSHGRKFKAVQVVDSEGRRFTVDGHAITMLGLKLNNVDYDSIKSVRRELINAFHAGLSALVTDGGYRIDMSALPDKTLVLDSKDSSRRPFTLGDLRRYVAHADKSQTKRDKENADADHTALEDIIAAEDWDDKKYNKSELERIEGRAAKGEADTSFTESDGDRYDNTEIERMMGLFPGEKHQAVSSLDALISGVKKPEFKDPDARASRQTKVVEQRLKNQIRKRGAAKKAMFRFFELTSTRLERIHPEINQAVKTFLDTHRKFSEQKLVQMSKKFTDANDIQRGYDDVIAGRETEAAKAYQEFINEIQEAVAEVDPDFVHADPNPIHLDMDMVNREKRGFTKILEDAGVKNVGELVERITLGQGFAEFAIEPNSKVVRGNKELKPALEALKDGGFLDNDAPRHIVRLIHAAGKRLGWAKDMQDYKRLVKEVHPANRDEFEHLMSGVTGRLGLDMKPWHRKLNSVAMAVQTATVLWFSGVASLPELSAVYSRARGLEDLTKDVRSVVHGKNREEMYKIAQDYEIVAGEVVEHSLTELYALNEMTTGRVSQRVARFVFKYNGQDAVTRFTRTLGVAVGRRFLEHHARNNDAQSKRMLSELGIDAETVLAHLDESKDELKLDTPAGKKYRDALHQFVHEAVTNPTADQLPLIANDPRFLIFTSLKKFFYGFYDNVHKALWRERNKLKGEGRGNLEAIAPMLMTAALAIPLAGLSEVLREMVKYPLGRKNPKNLQDWAFGTATATGGLGPLQAAQSAHEISGYGGSFLVSLAGPTSQLAYDAVRGELDWTRFAGPINQLPEARKRVKDAEKWVKKKLGID